MIAADTPALSTHMTISDASDLSGKGVTTIRRWLASGEIRHLKDGNGWIWIERQSIAGFLAIKNGGRAGASAAKQTDDFAKNKGGQKVVTADRAAVERLSAENVVLKDLVAHAYADRQTLEVENMKLRQRIAALEAVPAADELSAAAQKLAGVFKARFFRPRKTT